MSIDITDIYIYLFAVKKKSFIQIHINRAYLTRFVTSDKIDKPNKQRIEEIRKFYHIY